MIFFHETFRKTIDFFICGDFMSLLCFFFSSCCFSFHVHKRWVIGFDIANEKNKKTQKKIPSISKRGEKRATRTENILFLSLSFSAAGKIGNFWFCTCTNAVCPSRVMTNADTKSVGVIAIVLFQRKIHKDSI